MGVALLVVLETLTPAERLAFVLHDMFGVPFEEIAPIVDRTPTAARQLASRARRRVRGAPADRSAEPHRQRAVVRAFLAASREVEALVDGTAGAVWMVHRTPRVVFEFTIDGGSITAIDLRMDPAVIAEIDVEV